MNTPDFPAIERARIIFNKRLESQQLQLSKAIEKEFSNAVEETNRKNRKTKSNKEEIKTKTVEAKLTSLKARLTKRHPPEKGQVEIMKVVGQAVERQVLNHFKQDKSVWNHLKQDKSEKQVSNQFKQDKTEKQITIQFEQDKSKIHFNNNWYTVDENSSVDVRLRVSLLISTDQGRTVLTERITQMNKLLSI